MNRLLSGTYEDTEAHALTSSIWSMARRPDNRTAGIQRRRAAEAHSEQQRALQYLLRDLSRLVAKRRRATGERRERQHS
jgi:hypothetical protein